MKRYRFSALRIEITRRCNKKCPHCMKGDAQDVTMDENTIDKIFCDVEDADWVVIGSGEPLLELGRIEYLINKIIESKWSTRVIELTTNGSIQDERIIEALRLFCSARPGNVAFLRISNDQFHDVAEYEDAYSFYTQQANADAGIFVCYVLKDSKELGNLCYEGRAVNYIDSGSCQYQHGKGNVGYPYYHKHRIKICGNLIPCGLRILANGNVSFAEALSYENSDALSIGNILSESMTEIIDKHNQSCTLLCSEMDVLHIAQYGEYASIAPGVIPYLRFANMVYKQVLDLREKAKTLFPCIPTQEIITGLPFPNSLKMESIVIGLYRQCPEYTPNLVCNIKKYEYTSKHDVYLGAACSVILANLKKNRINLDYPTDSFQKFATDNKEILLGRRQAKNDMNFQCNSIGGNVPYNEDSSLAPGEKLTLSSLF